MATDLNYIKYVVEQIDLPDISFKKMFGEYMVYYKAVPVLLVCDDCVLSRFWKKHPNFSVKIANKDIHMTAQNCITCWILIIQILQGKRLLPYIIAEKTSQRNQNSNVFICPSFRAFLLLFCRVPNRCFLWKVPFYWYLVCMPGIKVRIVNIWLQCNNFVFCADNTLLLKLLFVPCVLNLLQIKYIFLRVSY